jgi:hypothetical protein
VLIQNLTDMRTQCLEQELVFDGDMDNFLMYQRENLESMQKMADFICRTWFDSFIIILIIMEGCIEAVNWRKEVYGMFMKTKEIIY